MSADSQSIPLIFRKNVLSMLATFFWFPALFMMSLTVADFTLDAYLSIRSTGRTFDFGAHLSRVFYFVLALPIYFPFLYWEFSNERWMAARLSLAIGEGSATCRQLSRHLRISPLRCIYVCTVLRLHSILESSVDSGERRYNLTVKAVEDLPRLRCLVAEQDSKEQARKKAIDDARHKKIERRRKARELGFTEVAE